MKFIPSNLSLKYDIHDLGIPFIVYPCYEGIETDGLDYLDGFDILHISYSYEPELDFTFVNSILISINEEFIFNNRLTESIEFEERIPNELLSYNEIEKSFIFKNMLNQDSHENYNGFLFNKLHGV